MYIDACIYIQNREWGARHPNWAGYLLGAFLEPLSDCPSVACSAARIIVMPHPAFACASCAYSMEMIIAAVCAPSLLPGLHVALPPVSR